MRIHQHGFGTSPGSFLGVVPFLLEPQHQRIATGPILKEFNLRTFEVSNIFPGHMPLYLKENDSLIFYRDDVLYQYDGQTEKLISIDKAPPRYPKRGSRGGDTYLVRVKSQPVAISSKEFVYVAPDHQLTKYNVKTQTKEKLPIHEVEPLFWRDTAGRLYCARWDEAYEVVAMNLETGKKHPLRLTHFYGMTYISSRDEMVYLSQPWYGPMYFFVGIPEPKFIHRYDFQTKESTMLGWGNPNAGIWLEPGTVDESLYKNDNNP